MKIRRRVMVLSVVLGVLWLLHIVVFGVAVRIFSDLSLSFVLLSFLVALTMMLCNAGPKIQDNLLTSSLYIASSTWLGFLFLFFSATVVYEGIRIVGLDELPLLYFHLMMIAFLAGCYALYNSRRLVNKDIKLVVPGLEQPVRIAHLSDVHIGTVHRDGFLRRVVDQTNHGNPDIVLMTGDLFDGSAPIHEEMLRPLDALQAPTYFSMGNHEEYEGLQLVRDTIQDLRMRLLDSEVAHEFGLQIIGINDRQSIPKSESLSTLLPSISYDREKPTVLMYHTPVEWKEAQEAGIDLMLSGHTHNGQVFPFTLLVHLAYRQVSGLYEEAGQYLHVSPGTGTWGPPMRLGSRNQITFINLVPK